MADLNTYTSGVALEPGSTGWLSAMADLGYQVSPDMPAFVLAGYPAVYPDAEPGRGPGVDPDPTPAPAPTLRPGAGAGATPTATRVPPPGVTGLPDSGLPTAPGGPPGNNFPTFIPNLNPFGDISSRIVSTLGNAVGAVFDGVRTVVERIAGTVRDLAQSVLPTIEELATAVASTAISALRFIADNLTDMADFGATLAGALVEPLYALLDAGGEKLRDWLLSLLRALTAALARVSGGLLTAGTIERLI